MQRFIAGLLIILAFSAQAQDWDDFEPPPPADFGNIPPPPPPPPMDDFSNGGGNYAPQSPAFSNSLQPSPPPKIGLGAVVFKKTGQQKDLTKKNPRIEELLRQAEQY